MKYILAPDRLDEIVAEVAAATDDQLAALNALPPQYDRPQMFPVTAGVHDYPDDLPTRMEVDRAMAALHRRDTRLWDLHGEERCWTLQRAYWHVRECLAAEAVRGSVDRSGGHFSRRQFAAMISAYQSVFGSVPDPHVLREEGGVVLLMPGNDLARRFGPGECTRTDVYTARYGTCTEGIVLGPGKEPDTIQVALHGGYGRGGFADWPLTMIWSAAATAYHANGPDSVALLGEQVAWPTRGATVSG